MQWVVVFFFPRVPGRWSAGRVCFHADGGPWATSQRAGPLPPARCAALPWWKWIFCYPPPPRRISAQAVHGSSHIGLWENTNSSEVYHEISRFSADFATICPFVYHQGTIVPTTFKVGLKRCCSPPGVAIFPLRGLSFRACQATTSRGRV